MTPAEKKEEWVRFVKASPPSYYANALAAVYESDGKEMLADVLKRLGWSLSADMIEAHSKHK